MRGGAAGAALLLTALSVLTGCSEPVPGTAVGVSAPEPGSAPQLASAGPRIAVPKKPDAVAACSIATPQQVGAALGPVTGAPDPLRGNASSCVWPLGSASLDGFLAGYGLAYEEVQRTHPATGGAFERTTDGNSTWLWCDIAEQTGAFTCGAAVALTAEQTFVTGLVRSPAAGRTKNSVLAELQSITIPLFRALPAG